MENLKFELVDILDQKQQSMQKQFAMELSRVKERYEEATEKVDMATKSLNDIFKSKMKVMKEKSALFYAKLEIKLQEQNKEVMGMSNLFRKW